MDRYIVPALTEHLREQRQMIFLTGPRQAGKTTLAQSFLRPCVPGENYFNWDTPEHRRQLLTKIFPGKVALPGTKDAILVFDEIHKYPRWKNTLKGLFDRYEPHARWIVTGSAMLNVYRRGQDSLLGRHFTYHLAPFSVSECLAKTHHILTPNELSHVEFTAPPTEAADALQVLSHFGGFPEPLFRAESSFLLRWRRTRLERLVNQDLASTEVLRHLPLVEQLMFLLPERVGSPLSLNALREDLEVHFATVRHWMELLERVFYGFYVRPFGKRGSRLLKKEAKWYLWDWSELTDPGVRFENLVAMHLRKYVDYINDLGLGELSLHYVRDKEKRESDFLLCAQRKPWLLIECKLAERALSPHLVHFAEQLGVSRALQVVASGGSERERRIGKTTYQVVPAPALLQWLA